MLMASESRQWPGDRQPTSLDVQHANESPATSFLNSFRAALLHDGGPSAPRSLLLSPEAPILQATATTLDSLETRNRVDARANYTYPMVLLSDLPSIPPEDDLARLQSLFRTSFKKHIYLDAVNTFDTATSHPPPYLRLSLACLANTTCSVVNTANHVTTPDPQQSQVSAALFTTGANLWAVMLEVDNREARKLEAVVAASFLATYGIMSTNDWNWRKSSGLLCNTATISRRLHLTDGYALDQSSSERSERDSGTNSYSSLMAYILLTDVVHAVHCRTTPTYSTTELYMRMPASNYHFRVIYTSLTQRHVPLPKDMQSREDALLLLTALLNDIIYHQRCHMATFVENDNDKPGPDDPLLRNPHAPLSAQSECARMTAQISNALDRWYQHFHHVGNDILALYYFCKLHLVYPDIWKLPHLAGYGHTAGVATEQSENSSKRGCPVAVSDQVVDIAWLVLDSCDMKSEPEDRRLAVWLPVVHFISALVVWQRLRSRRSPNMKYGTLKVLALFQNEIAQSPWPCCSEMIRTLETLMQK